jgi:hypothetical protein
MDVHKKGLGGGSMALAGLKSQCDTLVRSLCNDHGGLNSNRSHPRIMGAVFSPGERGGEHERNNQ